jgi:hypothetical protein
LLIVVTNIQLLLLVIVVATEVETIRPIVIFSVDDVDAVFSTSQQILPQ